MCCAVCACACRVYNHIKPPSVIASGSDYMLFKVSLVDMNFEGHSLEPLNCALIKPEICLDVCTPVQMKLFVHLMVQHHLVNLCPGNMIPTLHKWRVGEVCNGAECPLWLSYGL